MGYPFANPTYYLTAYGLALKHGFRGTEKEWLKSLTAYGIARAEGYEGTLAEWLVSLTAYGQAKAGGYTGTREEWLESLKGVTYTPYLTEDGSLGFTNDRGFPNPEPVNLLELEGILPGGIRKRIVFSVKAEEWKPVENPTSKFLYCCRVEDPEILETMVPSVILAEESLDVAAQCGMCATSSTYDGYLELKCKQIPTQTIYAACNLMSVGSYGPGSDGADGIFEHEVADDETVTEMLNEIFGPEP